MRAHFPVVGPGHRRARCRLRREARARAARSRADARARARARRPRRSTTAPSGDALESIADGRRGGRARQGGRGGPGGHDQLRVRPGGHPRRPIRRTLDRKAAILGANPNVKLQISGHADERGSDEYNLALGNRRAAAAKRYLENKGIDAVADGRRLLRRGASAQPRSRRGGLRPEPPRRVPGDGRRGQPRRSAVSSATRRLTAGLAATARGRGGAGGLRLQERRPDGAGRGGAAPGRDAAARLDPGRAARRGDPDAAADHGFARPSSRAGGRRSSRATSRHDLYNIQQQLVQLQELTGQSQQRLSELRTQLEARGAQIETADRATGRRPRPGDTAQPGRRRRPPPPTRCTRRRWRSSGGAAPAPPGWASASCSGPIRPARARPTRSTSSARASRRRTRTRPRRTTRRWWTSIPRPPGPPSALYNLGLLAERRKDNAKAKDAYQRVVQKYPQSDEAALARDRLKALGR